MAHALNIRASWRIYRWPVQLAEMQGEGRLREQDWRLELKGTAYAGKFNVEFEGQPPASQH